MVSIVLNEEYCSWLMVVLEQSKEPRNESEREKKAAKKNMFHIIYNDK